MSSSPSFISRWSRLKLEAERARAEAERAKAQLAALPAAAGSPAAPPAAAAPELPPLESLAGLESDYSVFMGAGVDADTRRAALKKLFADPHFNVMDGLDIYIDDYTQFEPLPAATRLMLNSAQEFLLESELEAIAQARAETEAAQAQLARAQAPAATAPLPATTAPAATPLSDNA